MDGRLAKKNFSSDNGPVDVGLVGVPDTRLNNAVGNSLAYLPTAPQLLETTKSSQGHQERDTSSSRQKVNFNVATVLGEPRFEESRSVPSRHGEPWASGREGDVEDRYDEDNTVVEAKMEYRALRPNPRG
jgi:hypothetical protein